MLSRGPFQTQELLKTTQQALWGRNSTRLSSHDTIKLLPCCTSEQTAPWALMLSSHTCVLTLLPTHHTCMLFLLWFCRGSGTKSQAVLLTSTEEAKKSLVKTVFRFETPAPLQSVSGSLNMDGPDRLASCMLHLHIIPKVTTWETSGGV